MPYFGYVLNFFFRNHESKPGVGVRDRAPGTRSPGLENLRPVLILNSGTGTGTQIHSLRDLGLGPGLTFEKPGSWSRADPWSKLVKAKFQNLNQRQPWSTVGAKLPRLTFYFMLSILYRLVCGKLFIYKFLCKML